jgi:RNA polymerase sigma-70 factor (ECF subfamily)
MSFIVKTSTVQSPTDEQLLEQLRFGSTSAFAQLYQRYKHRVYAYCHRLLRDAEAAEDVVQESFLKVHRGVHTLRKPELFRTWIFSVARNEALMHLRRARRWEDLSDECETVWNKGNPLDDIVEQETKEIIQHYLGLLKPRYRDLLVLREYEQLSYAEIAEITGIAESAVKSALFKARKALARKLEPIFKERHI